MTTRTHWTILGRTAVASVLLLAVGCFLDPREPEPGGGPVCFEKITQESELNVFANLNGSLRCRQPQSYLDQFAEDFVFEPSPSALAQNPAVANWNYDDEQAFVSQLFSSATDTIVANVYTQTDAPSGSGPIEFTGEYSITVVSSDGSEIEYSGTAVYTMIQDRAIWLIQRWREEDSERPFGLLRANLAQ